MAVVAAPLAVRSATTVAMLVGWNRPRDASRLAADGVLAPDAAALDDVEGVAVGVVVLAGCWVLLALAALLCSALLWLLLERRSRFVGLLVGWTFVDDDRVKNRESVM
ncbi:hypothetical protein BKA80DRAFT_255060 [Phyllosticta citrichinensis]